MRALLLLLLVLELVLAAPAWAQGEGGAARRGFWWEATRGEQKIVLAGTLHVGRSDFNPPAREHLQRLREAAVIAVEADVFNAEKVGTIVQRLAFFGEGEAGLDKRLSPELRKRVEAVASQRGLPGDAVWRMKPWMLANTLVLLEAVRAGFNPAYATEAFLFQFSQQTGKPLAELESVEAQLRLFDSAPAELQLVYLEQVVKSIESGESGREVSRLVDAWARSDAAAMEAMVAKMAAATTPADRFVREQVIDARHPAMVAAIEKMAASGRPHVVAVGSLHFFGPNGLVELLRKRGFTVRPL
jgi:uncharacterized protein YbaP (TraB family)